MFGKLLNTLNYHVSKLEKEWRAKSKLRTEFSYGGLRRALFFLAKKPLKWSLLIFLFFGALSIIFNTSILENLIYPFQKGLLPAKIQKSELATYFSSIWGVQTTIAAFIYPIVISFISLMLQGRNDARSYLNIYLHDTASIFSGLSSLFLVLLMSLQYILLPTIDVTELLNWLYIDLIYLVFNIVLVTYFLYQTFLYIKPSSRKESLKKYLINEMWPADFKSLVKPNLFDGAEDESSLLKFEELHTYPVVGKKLSIETGFIYESDFNPYEDYYTIHLEQVKELVDVRFFFLKLACRDWAKKAIYNSSENQVLAINVRPGYRYSGKVVVCKAQGEGKINKFQKLLFKLAFNFKIKKASEVFEVDTLLQDLKSESLRKLQSRDLQGFDDTLHDLSEFVSLLIKSSQAPGVNYSKVRRQNLWGGPQYDEWIKAYNELIESASKIIDENKEFISMLIIEARELYFMIDDIDDEKIKHRVVLLLKRIDYEISKWWVKKIENQGSTNHSLCNPIKLSAPYQTLYVDLMTDFIGSWEQIKNMNVLPRELGNFDWEELRPLHYLLKNHLSTNLKLLKNAITLGDIVQSEYLLDTMLKWFSSARCLSDSHVGHVLSEWEFVHEEVLYLDWSEIEEKFDLDRLRFQQEEETIIVFSLAIENLWVDYISIFLFWLSRQYLKCDGKDASLVTGIFKRIIKGDHPLKTGSIIPEPKPITDINGLFKAVLRMHYNGFEKRFNYNQKVVAVIRSVFDQNFMNMISGRSYSGHGGDDLYSMRDGILLSLLSMINGKWNPVSLYDDKFEKWIKRDLDSVTRMKRNFGDWVNRLEDQDFCKYEGFYDTVKISNSLSFDKAMEYLVAALDTFVSKVDETWEKMIIDGELDTEKLQAIERWSSSKVLTTVVDEFPSTLFNKIEFIDKNLKKADYSFTECERGWFTKPVLKSPSPGKDIYESLAAENLPHTIWQDVISRLNSSPVNVKNEKEYWDELKDFESKVISKGLTPILLLNTTHDPEWMSLWINEYNRKGYSKPDDFVFQKIESEEKTSCIGSINNIEVHLASRFIGYKQSLLVTKESFKKLTFTKRKDDQIISIDANTGNTAGKLDLIFKWFYKSKIDQNYSVLLKHDLPE